MASLIDNLLSSGFDLVIKWQYVSILRGTSRGDPQETLYRVRSPILFVRLVILMCDHNEAERSVWVIVPSSRRSSSVGANQRWVAPVDIHTFVQRKEKKKRKDSAGSDDTASMIKGGGYLGARTRQPPTAQTIRYDLMWVRGVVCRSTRTQSLTVVACVVLQCIPCFHVCRCMSDGVFVQFVCQFLILSRLRSARGSFDLCVNS